MKHQKLAARSWLKEVERERQWNLINNRNAIARNYGRWLCVAFLFVVFLRSGRICEQSTFAKFMYDAIILLLTARIERKCAFSIVSDASKQLIVILSRLNYRQFITFDCNWNGYWMWPSVKCFMRSFSCLVHWTTGTKYNSFEMRSKFSPFAIDTSDQCHIA